MSMTAEKTEKRMVFRLSLYYDADAELYAIEAALDAAADTAGKAGKHGADLRALAQRLGEIRLRLREAAARQGVY